MIACPKCHRVRRPTGLHICLAEALARRAAPAPLVAKVATEPRRINTITLPGDGPAARVWNALVEGNACRR